MTDVQCREERGRKQSLYNTPLSPSFPPLQPPTSPSPVRSLLELIHAGLLLVLLCVFHLAVHTSVIPTPHPPQLGIILSFTSSQSPNSHVQLIHSAPQLNWRRAPPCFLAASLPLLELLIQVSQWAMVRQRCLLFKHKSPSDQNDVGTALLLALFYVCKIDA